jgi:hypothetical protein
MVKGDLPNYVLTEYEKAQDSAEHHNTIMWNLIYIGIGLSLFILYKVHTENYPIEGEMLAFGAVILAYFSYIIFRSNKNKYIKYKVCKEIEEKNKILLGQHKKAGLNAFSYFILNSIISGIFLAYFYSILSTSYQRFAWLILIFIFFQIFYVINYLYITLKNEKTKKVKESRKIMNLEDKKFTFKASIAGGFVAGGTLLTYQLVLGWGAPVWLSVIIAGGVGYTIIIMSKKSLFKT